MDNSRKPAENDTDEEHSSKSETCDVCRDRPAEREFDVFDQSGAVLVSACSDCFDYTVTRLERVHNDRCVWCWDTVSSKYQMQVHGAETADSHARLCGGCRKQLFGKWAALRATGESQGEYDTRGNPIPSAADVCDGCDVTRAERPEGFAPEIMTPFGEVEYLCGSCRADGRGMA
jgi:hypothetical protein